MCAKAHERLKKGLEILQAQSVDDVNQQLLAPLEAYLLLLTKWNKVYNLTAVRDPLQMVDRHLMDSLILCSWLPRQPSAEIADFNVMDVGSGAGLPILPLAIARPDLTFASIESNGKKTRFQQQCLLELGLSNVTIINDRVENVSKTAHLVLSRAFTAPLEFLNIATSLCAKNGQVVITLGLAERFPSNLPTGYSLEELVEVDVPGSESARHVAVCRRH